jgi:uridine phosphorylase
MMGFSSGDLRISNFEMETSALYGLSRLMGHKAATVCAIIANRATLDYAEDHKAMIDKLVVNVLDQLSA